MTTLSEEILERWQIRKTKAQKLAFIARMQAAFPELRVEEGGFPRCRNLVLGDSEQAQVVFTAHYDTCARLPVPNFVAPKNLLLTLGYSLLLVIPFLLLIALLEGLLMGVLDAPFALGTFLPMLISFGLIFWVFVGGPANPHTVNDNTSGVLTLVELYQLLSEEERARCALVFFDHEETGLVGSSVFAARHRGAMRDKLLINFDCVSDGDHLLLVMSGKARRRWGEALREAFPETPGKTLHFERSSLAFYPSDQMQFRCGVGVAALHRKPLIGLYLSRIHTARDTVMQEENLQLLCEGARRLLYKI